MPVCSFILMNGSTQEGSYHFPLNPENLSYETAARTYQNQSRSALSVQRYGRGFTSIQLSGTTGFRGGSGKHTDNGHGKAKALELKTFLYNYLDLFSDDVSNNYKLLFVDALNNVVSQVELQPGGFTIQQNISSPLLYNYQINLMIVGDPSKATSSEISNAILGNDIIAQGNANLNSNGRSLYIDSRTMASSRNRAFSLVQNEFN